MAVTYGIEVTARWATITDVSIFGRTEQGLWWTDNAPTPGNAAIHANNNGHYLQVSQVHIDERTGGKLANGIVFDDVSYGTVDRLRALTLGEAAVRILTGSTGTAVTNSQLLTLGGDGNRWLIKTDADGGFIANNTGRAEGNQPGLTMVDTDGTNNVVASNMMYHTGTVAATYSIGAGDQSGNNF